METLINVLQEVGHAPAPTISLPRFIGRPQSPSDPTIDEWLSEFDGFMRQCGVSEGERAVVLVDYLVGVLMMKCYVTRMTFVGTSGPWCLCCGESLGRGRP